MKIYQMKEIHNKKRFHSTPYLLLVPSMTLFTLFSFLPFLQSIFLSLTVTDKKGTVISWAGVDNYIRLFTRSSFLKIMGNTMWFALLVGAFTFIIAVALALLCVEQRKGSRIYQTMFAVPMAIASAPASAIFLFVFKQNGMINMLTGLDISWLTSVDFAIYAVAFATVWLSIGASFIFLLVGFRAVPEELLESAKIDGAGKLRRVFSIMLPVASPQIFFVIFLNITNSFKAFGQIKLLTGGGPANSTETLIYSIYKEAILNGRFETACTLSLILFFIILVVTRAQMFTEKRMVHYQ
jgi:sn-glycerol 3-phosphate transport system permease protein